MDKLDQLYDALSSDGAEVGTREQFRDYMLRPGDEGYRNRLKFYKAMKEDGAEVGASYEDFRDWMFGKRVAQQATQGPSRGDGTPNGGQSGTAALHTTRGAGGAASSSTGEAAPGGAARATEAPEPKAEAAEPKAQAAWRPSPLQMAALGRSVSRFNDRMNAQREQVHRMTGSMTPGGRKRAAAGEMAARMAGTPSRVLGVTKPVAGGGAGTGGAVPSQTRAEVRQGAVPYGVVTVDGESKTQWLLPDGSLTTDLSVADQAEYVARQGRLWGEFKGRMVENGLNPDEAGDVHEQSMRDLFSRVDPDNAAERVWAMADEEAREDLKTQMESESSFSRIMRMLSGASNVTGGLGTENVEVGIKARAASMRHHNLRNMADDAWLLMGKEKQEAIVYDIAGRLRAGDPKASDEEIMDKAVRIALEYNDRRMAELAVKKNEPAGVVDFFLRKAIGSNAISSLMDAAARVQAGTSGDMAARDEAMARYENGGHRVAGIAGTVTGMLIDPLVFVSAGVGGAAVKGAAWGLGGAAARKAGTTLLGRIGMGAVGGAGNFTTFEAGGEFLNQARYGEFSGGKIVERAVHGLLLGSATGVVAPMVGNVSDKLVKATRSTAGKLGLRAAELGVSTVAEGTIFSVPEWIEGERDAMDVWTDNLAMMAGFKLQHGIKSAPRVISELRAKDNPANMAERNHNRMGFEGRLRKALDGRSDLALTADEKRELELGGYTDLNKFVAEYVRYIDKKEQREAARGKSGAVSPDRLVEAGELPDGITRELPYNRFAQLMSDGAISEAARAKMYYYLTGRTLPMSTVVRSSGVIENKDGSGKVESYTVQSWGANGVITSRTFGSRGAAEAEVERIDRQAELNVVDTGERYYDGKAEQSRMWAACERMSEETGAPTRILYEMMMKNPDEMSPEQLRWAERVNELYDGLGDVENGSSALREELNGEFGVDVDAAIKKEPGRRSAAEQSAVKEYARRLYEEPSRGDGTPDAEEQSGAAALHTTPLNESGDDVTTRGMSEARRRGYMADARGRRDIAIEVADPNNADNSDVQEAWDGVVERIEEEAAAMAAERREAAKQLRHTDGSYRVAVLKERGADDEEQLVYIIDGNVVMAADGLGVDASASDNVVVVVNPATGERKQIDPSSSTGISRLGLVTSGEDFDAAIERDRAEYVRAMIEAAREPQQGGGTTGAGEPGEAPGTGGTGSTSGAGGIGGARFVAGEPSEYVEGVEITILDENGTERPAMVMGRVRYDAENGEFVPDAEGNIVEFLMNGEAYHEHIHNMPDRVVSHIEEVAPDVVPAQTAEPVAEVEAEPVAPETVEAVAEAMPVGADGKKDYRAAGSERTMRHIYDELGISPANADKVVSNNIKAAEEALKKARKAAEKVGDKITDPDEMAQAERQAREAVEAAEATKAFWEEVQSRRRGVVEAERERSRAAEAEREAAEREKALREEAERQAAIEAERREQAERGAHAVHPAIREKWEAAPKVEGYENEITLPNGERVKGRYVLVESGAATASHNTNMDFARSEGFPVDENGNTINDRDYERDKSAQDVTREMGRTYDSRALQDVPVVSREGVVLSGNGRTMAGEIAAQDNTDGAYIEHLKKYGQQFGFTPEQVGTMEHPRVVFVPDADMPYTSETFAKFNAQQMKSQSRVEQAVKLGKTVDDSTFGRIIDSINEFDTLSDFYGAEAASRAIGDLRDAGVINAMQYAEMFDGDKVSAVGRQLLESALIGKAFEGNPEAVRQLSEYPAMRQRVVAALGAVVNNVKYGDGFSLEKELAEAINLAYQALSSGGKNQGEPVSDYARQLELFPFDLGRGSVSDFTNATIMLLGDLLNHGEVNKLKKVLALYNLQASSSSSGQLDLFSGGIVGKEEILKSVLEFLRYGTDKEKQSALAAAAEQRRVASGESGGESAGAQQVGVAGGGDGGSAEADDRQGGLAQAENLNLSDEVGQSGTAALHTTRGALDNRDAAGGGAGTGGGSENSATVQEETERVAKNQTPNAVQAALAAAEQETNIEPTEAQKEAGNYKKGHIKIDGYDVTIENPKGSVRRGTDASGKQWEQKMQNTYGYIRGTEGVDGDHIDVFFSDDPSQGDVFVVDQVNKDGSFDEHKVMYGFPDIESARKAYLSNYEDGWQGLGAITGVSKEEFKKWIGSSHRKTKPFVEYSSVKPLGDTQLGEQPNKPTAKAGEDYVSASERIAKEHEVKRTAAHFPMETPEEAAAFDKRVPEMDDVELLAYMQEDGKGDVNKAHHPSVYDEYDYRHGDEQLQSYDDTLVRLNESGTTLEQAEEMLANIQKDVSRLATDERAMLLGQEEALLEYIAGLEKISDEAGTQKKEYVDKKNGVNEDSRGVFEYFKGTLKELVELGKKAGNILQKMVLVPTISERLKTDLSSMGIVLDVPYRHTIDNFAIKHTFNEHASEDEKLRGQVPVTESDFHLATDVIENYDEISIDKNKRGQHIILYKKQYPDGRIIYVEEVRSPKKGELAFVSMRKYQAKKSGLPNEAEASTLGSSAKISSADSESPVATNQSLAGSATDISAGKGTDIFGNEQGSGKKSSSDGKIDDVGEVLAGARKDMRKEIAKSLANVTEAALVEKPFGKVYKKPDLKKAVESGALREKDAIFYEALFSMVNQQKPKVTQSEMRSKRYIPDFKTKAERWAADTFKQMEVLRQFMELDEPGRDAMMERMLADRYPTREQELAEIEKRKGWNPDYEGHKYEWGEMTTPNPLWVMHEVMNRLGYSVGDKLDVPYGVVKANTSGTGYSIENLRGERASLFGSGMTLDEAIDRIVYLAKLKRGDADVSHPTQLFAFPATKSESGESGRYRVMWGRDYKTREFDSKDEADAFAQTKNGAYVSPIMETKRKFGYKVRFTHPLTGEKMFVDDTEFDTEEEAQAYFDGNFEKLNEATNAKLQEEREKKGEKKTLTADDVVHVTMVHSGKGGWTHAVVIDKKYANNDGQVRIIKEGFASRKDAKAFADSVKDDVLKTVLKHKEDAKKIVYFDTGENSRIGEDYRNGKNVDAEDFMNTFGFRGVQFGNWTNQADRQMAVNQAYDAFMDMARLIGVSPKAMSLNGELGIAFGARGVGGFAAHYEPGEVVINLTKTQGAGSLAHEWWHALDNYFARRAGSAGDMVTDNRRIEMRDALRKAFNDMLDLVNGSDYAQRSAAKGEYWGRTHEITARLLAEWVDRELKKRGELNTFLSRGAVVERGQQHNYDVYEALERLAGREPMPFEEYKELPESLKGIPYPSAKEVEQFGGSLRHIFDTLEEQVDEETGNVVLFQKLPGSTIGREASEREVELRDALVEVMREAGMPVVVDAEGQRVLDAVNGRVQAMGSKVNRRMSEIGQSLSGIEMTVAQRMVVDVFSGIKDNQPIDVERPDGSRHVIMRQGNERGAGAKHSVFRHYGTGTGVISAVDVLKIPEVIEKGNITEKRRGNVRLVGYRYTDENGTRYTVVTEVKKKGEVFNDFYTNKKASNQTPQMPNGDTPESARTNDNDANSGAKLQKVGDSASDGGEKVSSDVLFDGAKKKFGVTRDIREAGYVLPDGTMLDFSGRHELLGADDSGIRGLRLTDHRAVGQIGWMYDENGDEVETGLATDMPDFIERGAIRIDCNAGTINLATAPTAAQRKVLRELIARNGGDVQVDFGNGWDSAHYAEYSEAKATRVLGDIERYFSEGVRPKGDIQFFRTAEGEVYGFVKDGVIYLDPKLADAETAIHEYGHLWGEALRSKNPAAWARLRGEMEADAELMAYVKSLYPELEGDALIDEVFQRYAGKRGAERLRAERDRMLGQADGILGKAGVVALFDKLRRLLERFWRMSRDLFAGVVDGLDRLSGADFADMMLADLLGGFNPNAAGARGEGLVAETGVADPFYSNAARAVENIKQGKAKAEQWKAMLTKAGGIKAGEDKWMGLTQWLDEHKGETLTKEQVLAFVRENGVKMVEREYIEAPYSFESLKREYDQWLHDEGFDYAQEQLLERFGDDADIAFDDLGGELVIANEEAAAALLGSEDIINSARLDYTTEGLDNKREIAFVVPGVEPYQESDAVHFGPENEGRAVMWVRFGETTDEDGNRVLVIDEIQSNRHQDAREKGYRERIDREALEEEEKRATSNLLDYRRVLRERYENDNIDYILNNLASTDEIREYRRLQGIRTRIDNQLVEWGTSSGVPAAPFEKNWHEVAMKRMLRLAAEEGFDKVAWTTGMQQAERYDLGKMVDEIRVIDAYDGVHEVMGFKDGERVFDRDVAGGERGLSELIGKEMARKAYSNLHEGMTEYLVNDAYVSLTGKDLAIGGDGMRGFYDQMLPRFMDKYGKKWGVKTGEVRLSTPGGEVMHSVDVTDAMRRSVLVEGQPLFQKADDGRENESIDEGGDDYREVSDDVTEDTTKYRIREEAAPKKTGVGYKVFVLKDGKLYPPMVANPGGEATPVGVWLDADAAPVAGLSKTGRPQVKAGGKGTQGGSGRLAYRPGWHLGEIPYASQFNRLNPETGERELFPANFVWAEVEYAADVDYQEEAMSYGMNANGKFQHSLAGLPRLPENGSYRYRTNPDPNTDPWVITGAMKVNRILKPSEVDAMVEAAGREPQQRQAGAITDEQVEALNANVTRAMREDRDMMRRAVEQAAAKLNAPVDIYESAEEVTHDDAAEQARRRRAKGWWDPKTGRIGIVLGNHRDVDDALATMGHETVAHYGLREMIGAERYNEFLDEVYAHLRDDLKARVDERAGRAFIDGLDGEAGGQSGAGRGRSYESYRREQVDELFGELAQKPFEEFSEGERTLWQRLKRWVRDLLDRFLGSLRLPKWFTLGDNELRYMLWRSKERLERGKEDPIELAADIVKREELGLNGDTRYAMGDAPETFRARQQRAVSERGVVMPGLNEAEVKVVDVPFHQYKGHDAITQARVAAVERYSKPGNGKKRVPLLQHYNNFGSRFDYVISPTSLKEAASHAEDSENIGVHIAVMDKLHDVINESIEIEEHPDVKKINDERKWENGFNDGILMHRFAGAVRIGNDIYRVKITMKEYEKPEIENGHYTYEVIKIEVMDEQPNTSDGRSNVSDVFVSGAKLLKKLEKSYDEGKNLLEESKKVENKPTLYRPGDDETGDIWRDGSLGMTERLTSAKVLLSSRHEGDRGLRMDALRAIGGNLRQLLSATSVQRRYDVSTVKRVVDLARVLLGSGMLNKPTEYEVSRLLSAVKNSVGRKDIEGSVDKVLDIMIGNQLRGAEAMLRELEGMKAVRVDDRGVRVQGRLDAFGAGVLETFKKSRHWSEKDIADAIAVRLNRMGSADAAVSDAAMMEHAGLELALEYVQEVQSSKAEESELRDALRELRESTPEADRRGNAYREQVSTIEAAIRTNKAERVESYYRLMEHLGAGVSESMERARQWREAQKARVAEIHHNANSDMEGVSAAEHGVERSRMKSTLLGLNNLLGKTLFAPLATYMEMLRLFGRKSFSGEGYLFDRFGRGWIAARQKELLGVREKFARLDAKATELFGSEGVKSWGDLIRWSGKRPGGKVSFMNGGEKEERELGQGHLLYIHMVNKMIDGQMKLRRMGVSEEDVAAIEAALDPRLIELADWLQEEFLVETRNEYNETHKRVFGASMAAVEHYFPLRVLRNARVDKAEDLDAPDYGDGISSVTGAIIKRRRNLLALDITRCDALSVILDHVAEMEHWNAFAEFNRDLNTLRTYKRFRNQVENMTTIYGNGEALWNKFNDLCQIAEGKYRPKQSDLDKGAVAFAQGVTSAKVSFRIHTALKQLLSLPAFMNQARIDDFIGSIMKPWEAWSWCIDNLPIFNERWSSRTSGDPRLLKSKMDWRDWRANIVQKAARVGMLPNAFVDTLTASMGAYAVYKSARRRYLGEGFGEALAERKAREDAEIAYNQTQQSSEGAFLSTMQVDRTWLSVMWSIFRNASMGYQRRLVDSLRLLSNNLTPSAYSENFEFEKKKLMREGLEEEQAERAARRRFRRAVLTSLVGVGLYGWLLQFLWNLGGSAYYLLTGDDEDEKSKMWDDIAAKSAFGSVEGLTGGDLMSEAGRMWLTGEGNPAYLSKDMPLTSDLLGILKKLGTTRQGEALTDMLNIVVSSGIGMNPQSVSDAVLGILDACGDDPSLGHEGALVVGRIISAPQSQLDKLYFDEVGLSGSEVSEYTPKELAARYARWKVKRGYLVSPWTWGDEAVLGKHEKKAEKLIKERMERLGDAAVNEAYERYAEVYSGVDAQVKASKKAAKTDYVEAARLMEAAQADSAAYRTYGLFKQFDGGLDKIAKGYLGAENAAEAQKCHEALIEYKSSMVELLGSEPGSEAFNAAVERMGEIVAGL